MAFVSAKIQKVYDYLFDELSDKRTKGWFLVDSPINVILFIVAYVYFVTKLGPLLMKNRKPFHLKQSMIFYNIVQIIVNVYLFVESIRYGYGPTGTYSFWCQPVDRSTSFEGMHACYCFYIYYMMKIMDCIDTIFMVLRKKHSHITFLHVYHHAGMVALSWAALKYHPGGHAAFFGLINTFVHAIMYGYYLLAAMYPPQERYQIGWKKYLTLLQMVQFFLMGIHISLPLFQPNCDYPKYTAFLVAPQVVFMAFLFTDFYKKTYNKTKDSSQMNGTSEPKKNGVLKLDENKNKRS